MECKKSVQGRFERNTKMLAKICLEYRTSEGTEVAPNQQVNIYFCIFLLKGELESQIWCTLFCLMRQSINSVFGKFHIYHTKINAKVCKEGSNWE
jgi:hypothetical protein